MIFGHFCHQRHPPSWLPFGVLGVVQSPCGSHWLCYCPLPLLLFFVVFFPEIIDYWWLLLAEMFDIYLLTFRHLQSVCNGRLGLLEPSLSSDHHESADCPHVTPVLIFLSSQRDIPRLSYVRQIEIWRATYRAIRRAAPHRTRQPQRSSWRD